jgi:hypothetical protein
MKRLLQQLAHSTLLPDDLAKPILAGTKPPTEEIVLAVIIGAIDAHAVIVGSPESSWNEKGMARLALAGAFLAALAVVGDAQSQR